MSMNLIQQLAPKSIKQIIKLYIGKLVPGNTTFSQCGEDRILNFIFPGKKDGFYVDIGAFHPLDLSNTYLFYQKGWHGINIDARPGSMKQFQKLRPRDINLEVAVSTNSQPLTYYQMSEVKSSMNSCNADFIESIGMDKEIINKTKIQSEKLSSILDKYLPNSQIIDFMSVDVEGMELDVLQSNDWHIYRPKIILIENFIKNTSILDSLNIVKYMENNEYQCFAKTPNGIFMLEKSVQTNAINQVV